MDMKPTIYLTEQHPQGRVEVIDGRSGGDAPPDFRFIDPALDGRNLVSPMDWDVERPGPHEGRIRVGRFIHSHVRHPAPCRSLQYLQLPENRLIRGRPRTGYLYVANNEESESETGRITIYDPARSSVVGFIHDVTGPMVFDPTQGELVVLHGSGAVFVSTTTNQVVATVPGLAPGGWRHPVLALDPVDGLVYAAQNFQSSGTIWLGSTIEVLSLRLHSAVAHIDGLWWTEGMMYNPRDGNLYVANVLGRMTVFDPRTNALVATFSGLTVQTRLRTIRTMGTCTSRATTDAT